jgi:hypothetical protein
MASRTKARKRPFDPATPRRVNFFMFADDFQCPLLAAIGLTTKAIAARTGLSEGQVMYRVMKYESQVRKNDADPTSRAKYRQGTSDIAKMMISSVTGHRSEVNKAITARMDKAGLYSPQPKGVMNNKHPATAGRMG